MTTEPENFSHAEYRRRHDAIMSEVDKRKLDALVVSSMNHLAYVAGDVVGYMFTGASLGLAAAVMLRKEVYLLVRVYETDSAAYLAPPWIKIVPYSGDAEDHRDPIDVLVELLDELGLESSAVGMELGSVGLTPTDVMALENALPRIRLENASDIISGCTVVKSEEELAVMRRAMRASEAGIAALADIECGETERTRAAQVIKSMVEAGSVYPFYQPYVTSSVRSALPHAVWSGRVIEQGDSVFCELSGSVLRYHAPLIRTAIVGRNAKAEEYYRLCEEALENALSVIRPGVLNGEVDDACRDVLKRAGKADLFQLRTGYQVGIDWVVRGGFSLLPGGTQPLVAGMTFHVRPLLLESRTLAVGCSETVVVTHNGVEKLSRGIRELFLR